MPLDRFQHEVSNRPWICDSLIDHFHNYSPDTIHIIKKFYAASCGAKVNDTHLNLAHNSSHSHLFAFK